MPPTFELIELQGTETARAPSRPGLYAWYYRPLAISPRNMHRIATSYGQFVDNPARATTEVKLRYELRWIGETKLTARQGGGRRPAIELIAQVVADGGEFFAEFIQRLLVPVFTKPLYIGIAKDLFARVYQQHFESLTELWDTSSDVSRYIAAHPEADVQSTMDALAIKHTFALEARVRGLAPRDLVAFLCPTDTLPSGTGEGSPRRALEQILQLLADPICGRQ